MRLKFERLDASLIPGTAKRLEEEAAARSGDEVDLINIVERLRNVPKVQSNLAFAEPVSSQLQPGDPGYRKPEAAAPRPVADQDEIDFGYGLKPGRFGSRS
jgi:uncharacterized protein